MSKRSKDKQRQTRSFIAEINCCDPQLQSIKAFLRLNLPQIGPCSISKRYQSLISMPFHFLQSACSDPLPTHQLPICIFAWTAAPARYSSHRREVDVVIDGGRITDVFRLVILTRLWPRWLFCCVPRCRLHTPPPDLVCAL